MLKLAIILCGILFFTAPALAAGVCISLHVPHAGVVGHGMEKRLSFPLYEATLYAPKGRYAADKPFALTLTYRMSFSRLDIAKESTRQIYLLGMTDTDMLDDWRRQLAGIFPDVKKNDSITGLQLANGQTLFCQSGRELGRMKDKKFGHLFFGIWLDKKAKNENLRQKLLGQS